MGALQKRGYPFLEYDEAVCITGEPAASSPPALAIEGGTLWEQSMQVYKLRRVQVSSMLNASALLKAAISASAILSAKPPGYGFGMFRGGSIALNLSSPALEKQRQHQKTPESDN